MCSLNILLIVARIAEIINSLMRANFIATNISFENKFDALPWADKIKANPPQESDAVPPTPQEVSTLAQQAFLNICDLYRLEPQKEGDADALRQAAVYIEMLTKTVSTMPSFHKVEMEPLARKAYSLAVQTLEKRQWITIKNDLMACRSLIYEVSSKPQQTTAPNDTIRVTLNVGNPDTWGKTSYIQP